jgi:hypothetical protein
MSALLLAFSYQLDRPFDLSVDGLQSWQPSCVRGVELRHATIDEPDIGVTRYRVTIRLRHRGRPLAMELRITPWSGASDTHLELLPLRRIRPNRRYFRSGRTLITEAVDTIRAHASADAVPPLRGLAKSA